MATKKQVEYGDVTDRSLALKTYGMTVVAAVMAAIVYLSMILLFNGLFTKSIGYDLYQKNEDGTLTKIETYYYKEGEGPAPNLDEDELKANNQTYQIFRSELEGGTLITYRLLTQLLMAVLLWLFPFNLLRERGEKDRTLVRAGCRDKDPWRGLRIGLYAAIPSCLAYAAFVIAQLVLESNMLFVVYRVMNLAFDPLMLWVSPDGDQGLAVSIVSLLTTLSLPVFTALGYTMGYRNIHPIRKLIYPNKKTKS